MLRTSFFIRSLLLLTIACSGLKIASAQAGEAQAALNESAKTGKYTFIMFYKQDDAATQKMFDVLNAGLEKKSNVAAIAASQVGQPTEQALVKKYDLARAPLPMTVVVAPNGAMTGMFPQKLDAASIDNAFVTPTMMHVMKNLQEGKLVLVTAYGSKKSSAAHGTPIAVQQFKEDEHFKDRLVNCSLTISDPQETKFLGQMKINPNSAETQLVLIAPPGVRVGNFDVSTTKDQIAAELAKAGKCCDDPNCKHHQHAPAQGAKPTR
jgi:hypothetical protein